VSDLHKNRSETPLKAEIRCFQVKRIVDSNRSAYRLGRIWWDIRRGTIIGLGDTMHSLESHPFEVERSSVVVSVLLPVLAGEDQAVSQYAHKLVMCDSDITSQLCPLCDLVRFEGSPKLDDLLGDVCEEWVWWKGERGHGRNIDSRTGLQRILLKEPKDFPWMGKFWGNS
jgi:hypothetical protein